MAENAAATLTCVPENLTLSFQDSIAADVSVTIDEDLHAPTDLHRQLWRPGSPLVESLQRAIASIGPVPDRSTLVDVLTDICREPLDGQFVNAVAATVDQANRVDEPTADVASKPWLDALALVRHRWNAPDYQLEDALAGPIALLAQLPHPPTLAVEISSSFVSNLKQQQRQALLGYLRRLTPGVDVRIIGSRLAIRRLIEQHGADVPGDVTERTWSALTGASSKTRSPERVAHHAIEELGLGDRQRSYWRLLTRICENIDGSVPQADLGDDLFVDLDASTVRKYCARFEDFGLVERLTITNTTHVRPTAAGQAALSLAQDEAPTLVSGWSTRTHQSDTAATQSHSTADVNDPPNRSAGPCTPNAREGREGPDRPTAEGSAAAAGTSSRTAPDVRFLGRHEHDAAAAAVPETGGIALEDRHLAEIIDDRAVGWSCNEDRNEVVVEFTASPTQAFTMVRACDALLNEKAESQLLTREKLNGGPENYDLDGLVVNNPYVLRKGRTLGWLRNQDCEGERFLDRLRQARNELKELASQTADNAEDGYYDSDELQELLRKAHGLQGVLLALYDLLGYDVVRKVRVPGSSDVDPRSLAKAILHQTSISSRKGIYTAHRVLYEPRDEKREDALGAPAVDVDDYRGIVSGSWVIEAPDTAPYREALTGPEAYHLELQDGECNYQEFLVDVDVVDANRREAVTAVVQRFTPRKNLRSDAQITTLLHALTGSTAAAAAAVQAMQPADTTRRMDHGDLEWGLHTLVATAPDGEPYFERFGAEALVPEIGGPTVSEVVAVLLKEDDSHSTSDVAEQAGVSTQSIRNNREAFDQLAELGLLEIDRTASGSADRWSLTFPGVGTGDLGRSVEQTGSLGCEIFGGPSLAGHEWRIDEAIGEYLIRLAENRSVDLAVGFGDAVFLEATAGPPAERKLLPLLAAVKDRLPSLRLLSSLLEASLPTEPYRSTLQFGTRPDFVSQQQTLQSTVAD